MIYEFMVTVGDWSRDGHNQFDTYVVYSNKPQEKVMEAYSKGCEKLGFDLIKEYCCEYEDNKIPEEIYEHFKHIVDIDEFRGKYTVWSETWADMVLHVAKLGDPELDVNIKELNSWKIGGYGLYY